VKPGQHEFPSQGWSDPTHIDVNGSEELDEVLKRTQLANVKDDVTSDSQFMLKK
jgi:hypothetical protein